MPEPGPGSRTLSRFCFRMGAGVLLFIVVILMIGFFPETGTGLDPTFDHVRGEFFPGPVTLITTSVDPNIEISIDKNHVSGGVPGPGIHTMAPSDDFEIGITNHYNDTVRVNGTCTFTDARGRKISATSFPPDVPSYHIIWSPYHIPATTKASYRFFLSLTESREPLASPPLNPDFNQSSRTIGTLICSVETVSRGSSPE